MGGVVEGASLGAAFQSFLTSVIDASLEIAHFRSQLKGLKSTLYFIKPVIDDVGRFDRILARPISETKAFTLRLLKAEELIKKCCKVKRWNVIKKLYYARKLRNLEGSLVRFFQVDVAAIHFRESKSISMKMSKLEEDINQLVATLKRSEIEDQQEEEEIMAP